MRILARSWRSAVPRPARRALGVGSAATRRRVGRRTGDRGVDTRSAGVTQLSHMAGHEPNPRASRDLVLERLLSGGCVPDSHDSIFGRLSVTPDDTFERTHDDRPGVALVERSARLGQEETLRRTAEMQLFGDGDGVAQMPKLNARSSRETVRLAQRSLLVVRCETLLPGRRAGDKTHRGGLIEVPEAPARGRA
jgi:hypothetical protein